MKIDNWVKNKRKKNQLDDFSLRTSWAHLFLARLDTGCAQRPPSIDALDIDWEKANAINRESSVSPSA